MSLAARVLLIALGIGILVFVVNLVRTRKLKEEYAILWLFTGIVLVLLPVIIDLLDTISFALGITYPPAFIGLVAAVCILFILFQFSTSISRFSERTKVLAQEVAILKERVRRLEAELAEARAAQKQEAGGTE
ncbi:MAG: DUF2304 domain-containing protein [Anaerolineae bacterium]|nr:DUF2304 domain-containing protein [Anaerolineae bacterium]